MTPREVKAELDKYVIGQDSAKRTLAVALHNHYTRINSYCEEDVDETQLPKCNVLLIGNTGTGKTLMVEQLAKIAGVPFATVDATSLSRTNTWGDNIDNALKKLFNNAYDMLVDEVTTWGEFEDITKVEDITPDQIVALAEVGILYIDEIDKLKKTDDKTNSYTGEGVQVSLLKPLEDASVEVCLSSNNRYEASAETIHMETRDILFIGSGSFDGITDVIKTRLKSKNTKSGNMGFTGELLNQKVDNEKDILLAAVTPDDITKFGFIPEFTARFSSLCVLNSLKREDLITILTTPKNAILKQYKKQFALNGINLKFTKEALTTIAQQAVEKNIGARSLKTILGHILRDLQYDLPGTKRKSFTVTQKFIESRGK